MKILIIEDDMSVRNVLRLSLEAKGFVIDEAEDGEIGSYLARTNTYDIIILDNVLPKKMGGHICKEIREANIETPIIMLSSKAEVLTKVDLLNKGADDYVTKPFSFEELLARLSAITRRPKQLKVKKIFIKDIEIDLTSQILIKSGREIYLTRKEFALLEFLVEQKNKVVSRGEILERVWEMSIDPFSNTIETHILNLRKKLKDSKKRLIVAVPGRGYRINID
jgi:DNA-binding response OmpR family regulator